MISIKPLKKHNRMDSTDGKGGVLLPEKVNSEEAIEHYLETLMSDMSQQRRQAIEALIADSVADDLNRNTLLDRLAEIIKGQSETIYRPTPDGLKEGEPQEYETMIRAAIVQQAAIQTVLGILGPDGLLDNERFVKLIDKTGMLERLGRWQHHITTMQQRASKVAEEFKAKHQGRAIRKVKIFGVGGSGAPHDIAAEIIRNFRKSSIEIEVVHTDTPYTDYVDEDTLVILSSFSGNTEETIHCYETVKHKTPLFVALAKAGKLREIARREDIPFVQLPEQADHRAYVMQPRESVCLQMTTILTFLACIGLASGSQGEFTMNDLAFEDVLPLIEGWRRRFGPQVPFKDNPAKQLAFFLLYGIDYKGEGNLTYNLWEKKVPFILVDRNNRAIGHEARTQFHERSKLNAAFYEAPEFLHNLVESIRATIESSNAGLEEDRWIYYFIRSLDEEKRIRLRLDKTIQLVIEDKASYAVLDAEGSTPYQRALFATYFNAYMTTYLGILNGFDPLPVPTMSWIKHVMKALPRDDGEEK